MSAGRAGFAILLAVLAAFGIGCNGSQEMADAGVELTSLEDSVRAAVLTEVWEPVPAVVTPGRAGATLWREENSVTWSFIRGIKPYPG